MKKTFINFAACLCILVSFSALLDSCKKQSSVLPQFVPIQPKADTPSGPVTYTLAWADEFNGTSVDLTKWTMETGNPDVNNEKEYYRAENATVDSGNLIITAKKESFGGAAYTSARMNTQGKFSTQYGRIEARIKLPLGAGLWPAFWSMGANLSTVSWPNCGEMDIMEHVNADNIIYGTMHWNGGNGHVQFGQQTTTTPNDYHLYAIEWDKNSIKWYVDSTLYVTGNIAGGVNNTGAFQLPFFLLLNMAVGGDFPGQTIDETKLPAKMYVDYVRVYTGK